MQKEQRESRVNRVQVSISKLTELCNAIDLLHCRACGLRQALYAANKAANITIHSEEPHARENGGCHLLRVAYCFSVCRTRRVADWLETEQEEVRHLASRNVFDA